MYMFVHNVVASNSVPYEQVNNSQDGATDNYITVRIHKTRKQSNIALNV